MRFEEDIAREITGETADGTQLTLDGDVLIYFKLIDFEQPVLNRLRTTTERTLIDELPLHKGFLFLGEPKEIKEELKKEIDKMFDAIEKYRETKIEK